MIHQSDMDALQRLEFCRAGGREMSEVKRYPCIHRTQVGDLVAREAYDALSAQRDDFSRQLGMWQSKQAATAEIAEHNAKVAGEAMAQRDEGLAREAELRSSIDRYDASAQTLHEVIGVLRGQRNALQQRLAEADKLLNTFPGFDAGPYDRGLWMAGFQARLASPGGAKIAERPSVCQQPQAHPARCGCADGEKP